MNIHSSSKFAMRAAFSFVLVAGLMLPVVSPGQAYASSDEDKDEVVYAKVDASGTTEGVYVVNIFDTSTDAQICDPADYLSVQNLSTTQTLEQSNGEVELSTTANTPFYYQGNLSAESQLPWKIDIKYYLDGVEKQPADLSGANGELKIVLDVQPVNEGDVADFAVSYILQAQASFSEDTFSISNGGDATIAHSGSDQVVTCLVLPGEAATFEITGTVHDFNYDGWQIAGMSLSMALDLANEDTSQLTDKTDELKNATKSLSSGASQIDSGAQDLASGTSELSSGVDSTVDGLSQLSSAGESLTQGWSSLDAGIDSLASGVSELKVGSDAFKAGLDSSAQEYASAASQLDAITAAYAQVAAMAQQALASGDSETAAQALSQMDAYAQQMAQVSAASGAYQALTGVQDSYSALGSGIDTLDGSTGALTGGAQSFGDGLSGYVDGVNKAAGSATQLQEGANQLAEGADSLSSAADQLSSGASTLASSVSGLDQKIIDELQSTIDEKLGKDFKTHSYVVPDNTNVDSVQFVYIVEGVSELDESANEGNSEADESKNQGVFDRLFALFTSQE